MGVPFRPPRRSLTARDYQFIALASILFIVLVGALIFINLSLDGGGDFLVNWVGIRAIMFDKVDPYSWQVAVQTQALVYPDLAAGGREPFILDTPFHLLVLYFFFGLVSDPDLARAVFTAVLELAMIAYGILVLRLSGWSGSRFLYIMFISFVVLNYYSVQAVLDANPAVLLSIIYLGMLFSLRAAADELLGALIALSLSQLEVGGPFLIFIILTVTREQRNRVLIGFLMVSTILLAISFLAYPGWPIPFLRALMNNFHSSFGHSLRNALAVLWPSRAEFLARVLGLMLAVLVIFEWSSARASDSRGFLWTACLTLTITPLLGWRTEMDHLATLVFPFLFVCVMAGERWKKRWTILTFVLVGIGWIIPWLLFYLSREPADPRLESLLFLFLPVLSLAGLYWVRWWVLRAPRTWLDHIEHGKQAGL